MTFPDDTLRAIYTQQLPERPGWPRTFEAAMEHPLVSRVLVLLARSDQALAHAIAQGVVTPRGGPWKARQRDPGSPRKPYSTPAPDGMDERTKSTGERPDDGAAS